jgi:hypothetical protein
MHEQAQEEWVRCVAQSVGIVTSFIVALFTELAVIAQRARSEMSDVLPPGHAFNHAPAALRIFRFAADTAPRALELAHITKFLRECAVDFGSADAALPGAMRNEFASGRFFKLRAIVERNAARCPWLAEKLMACRSGAPIPAAAMAADVMRHDVNWGAEGARRQSELQVTHGGFGLLCSEPGTWRWTQGPVGVTAGTHYFQVCVTVPGFARNIMLGFADDKLSVTEHDFIGKIGTNSSGEVYQSSGRYWFGTAPGDDSCVDAPKHQRPCVIGGFLDLDATPARMTVFVDGEPLAVQCDYDFPKDGRAWFPSVAVCEPDTAVHSCAM